MPFLGSRCGSPCGIGWKRQRHPRWSSVSVSRRRLRQPWRHCLPGSIVTRPTGSSSHRHRCSGGSCSRAISELLMQPLSPLWPNPDRSKKLNLIISPRFQRRYAVLLTLNFISRCSIGRDSADITRWSGGQASRRIQLLCWQQLCYDELRVSIGVGEAARVRVPGKTSASYARSVVKR